MKRSTKWGIVALFSVLMLFPMGNVFPPVRGVSENSIDSGLTAPILNWNTTWGGPSDDVFSAITVDSAGNFYITGHAYSWTDQWSQLWVGSYSSTGSLRWNTTWDGPNYDDGLGIAVDGNGHVYVVGYTASWSEGGNDVLFHKYDANTGTLESNTTWGGPSSEVGYDLALDTAGNIYITGYVGSFVSSLQVLLLKYDSDMNLLWNKSWGSPNADAGQAIIYDPAGYLYVTGYTQGWDVPNNNILIAKFSADTGQNIGYSMWGGPEDDFGSALTIDTNGNLYVTGDIFSTTTNSVDLWVGMFNPSGGLIWAQNWSGPEDDRGTDIAITPDGEICVIGLSDSWTLGGVNDGWLALYDGLGNLEWYSTWGGPGPDSFKGMVLSKEGIAYIVGSTGSWIPGGVNDGVFLAFAIFNQTPWWMISFLGLPVWGWIIIATETILIIIFITRRSKKKVR